MNSPPERQGITIAHESPAKLVLKTLRRDL